MDPNGDSNQREPSIDYAEARRIGLREFLRRRRNMQIGRRSGTRERTPDVDTPIRRAVRELVAELPGITQREIAKRLNASPSTIFAALRALERVGLVRIERKAVAPESYSEGRVPHRVYLANANTDNHGGVPA